MQVPVGKESIMLLTCKNRGITKLKTKLRSKVKFLQNAIVTNGMKERFRKKNTRIKRLEEKTNRINTRVDTLKSLTLSPIQKLTEKTNRVNARIDKLKSLTVTPIQIMSERLSAIEKSMRLPNNQKPPFYENSKMLTYLIDREFGEQQKRWFIEKQVSRALGYFPMLNDPKTFNEKTNWYKLNYKDPLITRCIDKHLFKEHITDVLGDEFVTPTLGVWDHPSEIDFQLLPQQFVLKSNWGSGSRHVLIVKDKSKLKIDLARAKMNEWIQPWQNVYYHTFDWGYKDIEPKIIAERFIDNRVIDYRFFCFNGEPKFFVVATDQAPGSKKIYQNYYDMNWKLLPVQQRSGNFPTPPSKPQNFDEMLDLCRKLSLPFPHVRIDITQTSAGLLVEEFTFYHSSGTCKFNPPEWDLILGEHFTLPKQRSLSND